MADVVTYDVVPKPQRMCSIKGELTKLVRQAGTSKTFKEKFTQEWEWHIIKGCFLSFSVLQVNMIIAVFVSGKSVQIKGTVTCYDKESKEFVAGELTKLNKMLEDRLVLYPGMFIDLRYEQNVKYY